jgi:hypothetical protein
VTAVYCSVLGYHHKVELPKQKSSLMFVRCIASLGITDQHYALIIIPLFITQAPTCFGTYVSSSGSVLYTCDLLNVRNCCVIGMYPVLDDVTTSVYNTYIYIGGTRWCSG